MTAPTSHTIAGRYDLSARVGAGGTGAVYRAHDRVLDRTVAVKLLRPGHDETARARLRAEAQIAASLSHPGIAQVLDYGEEVAGGEVCPYLVMAYVDGVSLRDVLRGGPLPPQRVADLIAQVADALAVAHAAGVVHRDVKPANIMLTAGGRAVLLDFGIARRADLEPLTVTGFLVGTVDYISPEQAAGEGATPRSDLYALGMVAYEALTGTRALSRQTEIATLVAHAIDDVEPLPAEIPPGLRALVEQLCQRDPVRRPADAAAVADRARKTATGGAASARRVTRDVAVRGHRAERPHVLLLAVGVAALVLAALGTVLTRGSAEEGIRTAAGAHASTPVAGRAKGPAGVPATGGVLRASSSGIQAVATVTSMVSANSASPKRHATRAGAHGPGRGGGDRHIERSGTGHADGARADRGHALGHDKHHGHDHGTETGHARSHR